MPARQASESIEDRVTREILEEDDENVNSIAAQAGPPPDSNKLSESDEDEAWEFEDRQVDHDAMAAQLMTQGIPEDVVQKLMIAKLRPDWAPLYQQPTKDAERADMLVKLAKRPFRLSILEDIDDPDERARKAESLDRRYQKRLTALQEQAAQPGMVRTTTGYQGMEQQQP